MRRRELIALLGASALAFPQAAAAEAPIARVAVLRDLPLANPEIARLWQIFADALAKRGWSEGRNVAFEHRAGEGHAERYRDFAAALVALKPALIITINSEATAAVAAQTKAIPIVMIGPGDPVRAGLVASLARPGGNITGVSSQLNDVSGKVLQLIRELRPEASRVALFWRADNPGSIIGKQDFETAARDLGVAVEPMLVTNDAQLESALSMLAAEQPDALVVPPMPPLVWHTGEIADFAIAHSLPTFAFSPAMVRAGLLMSLGPRGDEMVRRAAAIVAKVLDGTRPADIPVEQPTNFALTLNLKTAKALGLAVPPLLLAQADEVIE
jgi:putative ABC transport system substrate-binding protein